MFLRILPAILLALAAQAHQQPTTLVILELNGERAAMSLHLPLSELELAFGHRVSERPEETISTWAAPLGEYLTNRIHPASPGGQPWRVAVTGMSISHAEQTQSGPFQEVHVNLSLTPPPGASRRSLVLRYDVILHQVVTHKALVSIQSDWLTGRTLPTQVATIAVDTGTGRIEPAVIELGEGSWWTGFRAMVEMGVRHIREGTDHLLFLIVLLLPATLRISGRRWSGFAGAHESLVRVVKIVTAFTLGHSATLLAGSLHWVRLPQQPVEVVIAVSILVTALHAVRPLFPAWETRVAAGFGLVHGLAFASVLAELQLTGGPFVLSLLGFNLGIELMQLFVVAVTLPWLVLLSATPAHRCVRVGGALLAAIAATGWIVNRVSGQPNPIERLMTELTGVSPLGILILALIAITAYSFTWYSTRMELNQ